ncbi:MAG TPA: sigma-70 family RNA polymerase sigma factor [Myxococcota bacterium]|nr:sigma-70 family RNA polymerase sigma factor [Myxococcota bacterium]
MSTSDLPRTGAAMWRELDKKLRPFVTRRVPERDVDDVLQEIFLRISRGIGTLNDDERFGPWVHTLARHAIADHLRAAARNPLVAEEQDPARTAGPPTDDDMPGVQDHDAASELATYLVPFVAALPSPYREALTLVELQGMSQREAAAMLGLSHSGMKSRVQRGRAMLRRSFEDCCTIALDARGHITEFTPRPDGRLPDNCCE